jgi:hypothetical protein
MKVLTYLALIVSLFLLVNCSNPSSTTEENSDSTTVSTGSADGGVSSGGNYIDLKTGNKVVTNTEGKYVDESGSAVRYYVNMDTHDTIDAETGVTVNNSLIFDNGDWRVNTDMNTNTDNSTSGETKLKTEDGKMKTEGSETKVKSK